MADTFDNLLTRRRYESPRSGFEGRILAAARATPQRRQVRLGDWLGRALSDLMLPHPRMAAALTLMLGIMLGLSAHLPTRGENALQTYLDDDGAVL